MRHGYGNFGWDGSWIVMVALMVLFWGGLAWVVVTLLRRNAGPHHASATPTAPAPPPVPPVAAKPLRDPEAILAERLATGDIDPDDYRQRLQALREHREG